MSPVFHPTYRALNKPLTIWGVERRLFFLSAIVSAATFNFFGSLSGSLLMFVALFAAARRVTTNDSQMLRILLNSAQHKHRYDAAKFKAFEGRHG